MIDLGSVMTRYTIYFLIDALGFAVFALLAAIRLKHGMSHIRWVIFNCMTCWALMFFSFAYIRTGMALHGPDFLRLTGWGTEVIRFVAMLTFLKVVYEYGWGHRKRGDVGGIPLEPLMDGNEEGV